MPPSQDDAASTVSVGARLGTVAVMFVLAVLVSALLDPNPSLSGVVISFVAAPIFPVGLLYLVHTPGSGGVSDAQTVLACFFPYFIYAAILALVLKARSMSTFLLVCVLLVVVLALNVKGCTAVGQTRWVSS